jgi:hypothetical protein
MARSGRRRAIGRGIGAAVSALALAATAVGVLAGPVSSGVSGFFTVRKIFVGTAPAGTTFTVDGVCTTDGHHQTLTFDANGNTTNNQVAISSNDQTCSATETGLGGAGNVAYNCAANAPVTCVSPTGNQLTIGATVPPTSFGMITIINTFLPPLTVAPSPALPGQVVTISGTDCTKEVFGGSQGTGGPVSVTVGFPTPVTVPTTAAGTTGSWSVQVTVPAGTPAASYPVTATCSDPVPYPAATLGVAIATTPAFTG